MALGFGWGINEQCRPRARQTTGSDGDLGQLMGTLTISRTGQGSAPAACCHHAGLWAPATRFSNGMPEI